LDHASRCELSAGQTAGLCCFAAEGAAAVAEFAVCSFGRIFFRAAGDHGCGKQAAKSSWANPLRDIYAEPSVVSAAVAAVFCAAVSVSILFSHARAKATVRGYYTAEMRELYLRAIADVRGEVIAGRVRSALAVAIEQEFSRCKVSILYLQGDQDWLIPRHNLGDMKKCQPAMQVAQIDASHSVLQSHPAESADAIMNFLSSLG